MAKLVHIMIRVLDEQRSLDFYKSAFNLDVEQRIDFEEFTLVYLKNKNSEFELELTINKGNSEAYDHGTGYGHFAVVVDDLEQEHARLHALDLNPADIKEFFQNEILLAKFFFIQDPDGYKIEVLQNHGRFM